MFLQVLGAARGVTGSCYLVEVGQTRFLVDCGMHQGGDEEEALNFDRFPFEPPASTSCCSPTPTSTTRAGIPRLVKKGFVRPYLPTPAT